MLAELGMIVLKKESLNFFAVLGDLDTEISIN